MLVAVVVVVGYALLSTTSLRGRPHQGRLMVSTGCYGMIGLVIGVGGVCGRLALVSRGTCCVCMPCVVLDGGGADVEGRLKREEE